MMVSKNTAMLLTTNHSKAHPLVNILNYKHVKYLQYNLLKLNNYKSTVKTR